MRLVRPGHVAGCHHEPCDLAPARWHELVDGPVLKHDAEHEHDEAQGVVYEARLGGLGRAEVVGEPL